MGNPVISGGNGSDGKVSVLGKDGTPLAELLAFDKEAVIGAGNKNRPGRLTMFNGAGQRTVNLTTADATLALGGNTVNGKVSILGPDGMPLVELLGPKGEAVIGAGSKNRPGRLTMYNGAGQDTVNLTAANATLALGGPGGNGTVSVRGKDGMPLVELLGLDNECVIGLGQSNRPGRLTVYNGSQAPSIELNGAQGDIWIANADCAEEFDLAAADAEPGMVMVLTEEGGVAPSATAYDSRVVGVVSGAGTYRPGLVLDRRETGAKRIPIALMGKVFCFVDATEAPVRVGDLLTTAGRKGYAMRALDPRASFGAVLGKALSPLASGFGLVPVLVTLQ